MSTAFVLSGGGSLGAVQVGMLQALNERDIRPDLLVGTSAGALNAAFVAGNGTDATGLATLAEVWGRLRGRTLFPLDPRRAVSALAGRQSSLCSDRGLRALLSHHLRFRDLEDSPIPLTIVATDLLTGREVAMRSGDATSAILASCAIPAIFPTVHREGVALVDGGLANNAAISQAVAAGATTIYVLASGYACALAQPPRTAISTALHALSLMIHQRLVADVELYAGQVDLIVVPPPCPLRVSPGDFGRAGELIALARAGAHVWLDDNDGRRADPGAGIAWHSHEEVGRATGASGRPAP